MHRRLTLTFAAVALLALTAGCLGTGPTTEQLQANQTYDWETDANATYEIERGGIIDGDSAKAVYELNGTKEVELFRRGITRTRPVTIESVAFRHPNGTVESYDPDRFEVERTGRRTRVVAPATEGQLALTVEIDPRRFRLVSTTNGTTRVILPPEHRATDLLLGHASPRGYETEQRGDRQVLTWSEFEAERTIVVHYYLARDRFVFYGLGLAFVGVAIGVVLYFRRRLEALRQRRKEYGLDVDIDDDDDDPPPGL